MRRLLAGTALAVGLIAGSFAWWGFTLERTVGDAGRADEVVDVLLDQGGVQEGLAEATETALRGALPADLAVALTPAQVEAVARSALAGPESQAAVRQALLAVHGYVTGSQEAVPVLAGGAVDAAMRQQLVAVRPDLAAAVPSVAPLSVALPDQGLEAARSSRRELADSVRLAAVVAAVSLAVALVVSPRRSRVLRTVGWWALVTGGLGVVLRFAVPAFAEAALPAGPSLIGGLAAAVAESMLWPGLILVALGNMLFLGGSLIDWAERQQHARHVARPHDDLRWSSHADLPPPAPVPVGAGATPTPAGRPLRRSIPDDITIADRG